MDNLIYTAMSGAKQTEQALTVNSNNLANASTTGFRSDLVSFHTMMTPATELPTRVHVVAGSAGINLGYGSLATTGRELDVAIRGEGFLAVQGADGLEAYTRRGDLQIDSNGMLTTGDSHPVLGNAGPIAIPPAQKIEIAVDGTISILPIGQAASTLAVVDRIRLVQSGTDPMRKREDGLLQTLDAVNLPPDASIQLSTGALESSNVNAVDALINMIALSRLFETQIKLMHESAEMDKASAATMQLA